MDVHGNTGPKARTFEFAEGGWAAVGNAADDCGSSKWPLNEEHFVAEYALFMFLGNQVSVGIDFRITENGGDPVFESFGDEVFQPLCLLMHLVPRVLQNIVEKEFEKAVMPHKFPGPPLSGSSEPNTPVLFIQHERWPL